MLSLPLSPAAKTALCALALMTGACRAGDQPAGAAPTFVYHEPGLMVPFPSDRYLVKDDGPRLASDEQATGYRLELAPYRDSDPALVNTPFLAESLATLDGFGTSAEIAVGLTYGADVTALSDEATAYERSVAEDSPIILMSIDPHDAAAGTPLPFVARLESDGNLLFLRPWRPLRPAGWYAVLFKPGLRDGAGRTFVSPPGFTRDFVAPDTTLEGEGYARLGEVYGGPVVFALTFRTASIYPKLQALIEREREAAASAITYATRAPLAGQTAVAILVEGWFTHRSYLNGRGKLENTVVFEEQLPFTLALPLTSAAVREPFPVVLTQHGFGNMRQGMLHLADAFAREGLATLVIDAPNHGARGPGDGIAEDFLTGLENTFGIWTDGDHMSFRAWLFRDILRDQVLAHLQLLKAVKAWQGDVARVTNEPGADLNVDEAGYIGHSMGAIMGGVSGAMLPELKRVVLNVGGGPISEVFVRNQAADRMAVSLLKPRESTTGEGWRMIAMVQTCLEPGDPINFIARIGREPFAGEAPRPLLMQAIHRDMLVPNHASYGWARAVDAPLVGPYWPAPPDVRSLRLAAQGLGGDDATALAFFREVSFGGPPVVGDHGNMIGSITALSQSAPFLKRGVIVEPVAP